MDGAILNLNLTGVFGTVGNIGGNINADASAQGSFGQVLGARMDADNVVLSEPAVMDAEQNSEELLSGLAALAAQLLPENKDISADTFNDQGAEAFLGTLDRFLSDGEISAEDIKALWNNVPEEEKAAYMQLLNVICKGSSEDNSVITLTNDEGEKESLSVAELLSRIASEAAKLRKSKSCCKCELDVNDQAEILSVLTVPSEGTVPEETGNLNVRDNENIQIVDDPGSIQNVIDNPFGMQINDTSGNIQIVDNSGDIHIVDNSGNIPSVNNNSHLQIVDNQNNIQDVNNIPNELNTVDPEGNIPANNVPNSVTVDDGQRVLQVSDTNDNELQIFCKCLCNELKAEITAEKTTHASKDRPMTDAFSSGRQAFMSRVKIAFEEDTVPSVSEAKTDIAQAALVQSAPDSQDPAQTGSSLEYDYAQPIDAADTPVLAARLTEQIQRIEAYENRNGADISMMLSPEGLGDIRVRIKKTDGGMNICFAAQKAEAAAMISDRVSALAQALAENGIKLSRLNVTQQIISEHSDNNALAYMGGSRDEFADAHNSNGQSRHFVFNDGVITEEAFSGNADEDPEIYYNREAKLWVSA